MNDEKTQIADGVASTLNAELYALILKVLNGAKIPKSAPDANILDFVFDSIDGWKVAVFYDGGYFDYVDYVITPDGAILDFWDEIYWPNGCDNEYRKKLINWNGV